MYVLTMKFSKKIAVTVLIAIAVALAVLVILVGVLGREGSDTVNLIGLGNGIKTNDDRIEYLAGLGWECDEEVVEEQKIVIPREFDAVFSEYNTLQKQQGFDLSQFGGLEVTMYRYRVNNYSAAEDVVLAQLIVLNYEVVGGDIHSTAMDGFMHALK